MFDRWRTKLLYWILMFVCYISRIPTAPIERCADTTSGIRTSSSSTGQSSTGHSPSNHRPTRRRSGVREMNPLSFDLVAARDMWKKKYYAEKKKTPALEDQQRQLKLDLEQIQQRILQTVENESKHSSQMGHLKGSEINVMSTKRCLSSRTFSCFSSAAGFHSPNYSNSASAARSQSSDRPC